jgi:hypothetical protein
LIGKRTAFDPASRMLVFFGSLPLEILLPRDKPLIGTETAALEVK